MDEVIGRAIAGDRVAIAGLYKQYTPQLRYYFASRAGGLDIDDLTSDVWVRVLRALPTYEDRGWPFSAWLYRVAWSCLIDARRYQHRRSKTALPPLDALNDGPEAQIEAWDAQASVPQLLASLRTEQQRVVIVRRFLCDQSLDEVADATGLSVGAVKALQHRALAAMRQSCLQL